MRHGDAVSVFEDVFARYVGAEFAIGMTNGTCTLQVALMALGVRGGDEVAVPPLTMSSTTIAVLHAGGTPVFVDVDPDTWIMRQPVSGPVAMPVSLYGLHAPDMGDACVDDAAQTLRPHGLGRAGFTSYSTQRSKILSTGEGGVLVTDDEALAQRARSIGSLGYVMGAKQARIDSSVIKAPGYARHHVLGINARMNDATARVALMGIPGLTLSEGWDELKRQRRQAAAHYAEAVRGCPWIKPQHVPDGWEHDYWAFAVALESAELWEPFTDAIVRHGGERPYGAWRLTYQEPAFRHLAEDGCCPVAEDLQPRLCQMQTNDVRQAKRNADAVYAAIREIE